MGSRAASAGDGAEGTDDELSAVAPALPVTVDGADDEDEADDDDAPAVRGLVAAAAAAEREDGEEIFRGEVGERGEVADVRDDGGDEGGGVVLRLTRRNKETNTSDTRQNLSRQYEPSCRTSSMQSHA